MSAWVFFCQTCCLEFDEPWCSICGQRLAYTPDPADRDPGVASFAPILVQTRKKEKA